MFQVPFPFHRTQGEEASSTFPPRWRPSPGVMEPESGERVYTKTPMGAKLRGSPSLVGRWIANPVRSAPGGSNPPPRAGTRVLRGSKSPSDFHEARRRGEPDMVAIDRTRLKGLIEREDQRFIEEHPKSRELSERAKR